MNGEEIARFINSAKAETELNNCKKYIWFFLLKDVNFHIICTSLSKLKNLFFFIQ